MRTMAIPDRFKLQPVSKQLLAEVMTLCDSIESELEAGGTAELLLQRWHTHTRRQFDPYKFRTYWKSVSKKTFVRDALNPAPALTEDLWCFEARDVLEAIGGADLSESAKTYYLAWLEAQLPGSNISDLIFWPDVRFGDASLFRDKNGAFKPEATFQVIKSWATPWRNRAANFRVHQSM
jgi:hypothetical protein